MKEKNALAPWTGAHGDDQLIGAGPISPSCEAVSICGASKFRCIAETSTLNKLDQTYANIQQILVYALQDYDTSVIPSKSRLSRPSLHSRGVPETRRLAP